MTTSKLTRTGCAVAVVAVLISGRAAHAQEVPAPADPPAATPSQPSDERPTGLPRPTAWTFNFDAGLGSFSFLNSLFTNPHDEPSGNLSDNWVEGYIKPSLSGVFALPNGSTLLGTASAVGERTYGSAPDLVGGDFSSFGPDELWVGWHSGTALSGLGNDALQFTAGRVRYELGHGFLLYDGAGEGGSRGGYWSNARKAFEFGSVARVVHGHHTGEVFYLDKDELPEAETGSRLWGANYEFRIGETSTFGATYMRWYAHRDVEPGRDGLRVFNARAYTAPIPKHEALAFEFEYAHEANGEALTSNAWTLQGAYQLNAVTWTPKVSYRYAFFQGDNPATPANEAFDPLFLGFSDWGTWWQGEIAGEYFLSNSNLKSHQIRVHTEPAPKLGAGLIVYRFLADRRAAYGPAVTSSNLAFEADLYADWKLNQNVTVTFVGGFANPGDAVRQATGRTANLGLGMVYVTYSY